MEKIKNENQIIEVSITPYERDIILQKANARGVLNHRTLMGGEGNASGYAGELIVGKYLKGSGFRYDADRSRDWDFVSQDQKMFIDVKTKGNALRPKINFDCTVPMNQTNQKCTHYIFVRTSKDLSRGWIKGWISKQEFVELAEKRYAGQAYNNEGRPTREDHRVLLASQLFPIQSLIDMVTIKVA